MNIFSKIRPLQDSEKIATPDGRPTLTFQRLWQQLIGNPESLVDDVAGKQGADGDLDGLSALTGQGLVTRTADDTYTVRTLQEGDGISITNPAGIAGDPVITCTVTGGGVLPLVDGSIPPVFIQNPDGSLVYGEI